MIYGILLYKFEHYCIYSLELKPENRHYLKSDKMFFTIHTYNNITYF